MKDNRLEYKMYFFVPYNISAEQKGIQAGHAAIEYVKDYYHTQECQDFMEYDKTWIILNGGTTNYTLDLNDDVNIRRFHGTMNNILLDIRTQNAKNKLNIAATSFNEPDLNDALSAICFLADERVWDYETYPDLEDFMKNCISDNIIWRRMFKNGPYKYEDILEKFPEYEWSYNEWKASLGGDKNVFLRSLIKGKKLA